MFLAVVCGRFAPLCAERGDGFRAELMKGTTALLRQNLDKSCWDGNWYLRAFYDDGTPLGSHKSEECRIDLLSQSFAVFAGMPDASRVQTALDSALDRLVDHEGRIVKLFTPPFDRSDHNPGYIKAYPTGIRENGGQYTHAAIWLALALLERAARRRAGGCSTMLNPASRCTDAALARATRPSPTTSPPTFTPTPGAAATGAGASIPARRRGTTARWSADCWDWASTAGRSPFRPALPRKLEPFLGYGTGGGGDLRDRMSRTGKRTLTVDGNPAEEIPLDGASHTILLTI